MHRTVARTYVGKPSEKVTVTVAASPVSAVTRLILNDEDRGDGSPLVFNLNDTPGRVDRLSITLIGPPGSTASVMIATVDDGGDGDLLISSVSAPVPVSFYTFTVLDSNQHALVAEHHAKKGAKVQ